MNKKVITLCAAALLFGAGVNSTYAIDQTAVSITTTNDVKIENGVKFYLGSAENSLVKVSKVTNNKVAYQTVKEGATATDAADAAVFEIRNVKAVTGGVEFDLYVNGIQYASQANGSAITATTAAKDIVTRYAAKTTKLSGIEAIYVAGVGQAAAFGTTGKAFTAEGTYNVADLKEYNSKGTTFSFETKKNLVGNPFNSLTPVQTTAGVIFVKGKKADIDAFAADPTVEANAKKVQVLALTDPDKEYYQISGRQEFEGLKFRWMKGENYLGTDSASFATFTSIKELDVLNGTQEFELKMAPKSNEVIVKALTATPSDVNAYVTTVLGASITAAKYTALVNPTLGDNSYLDPSILLKDTKNIVSIYFTSGDKSQGYDEYEQKVYHKYLVASGMDDATVLPANSIDFTNPVAQWVVSDFDGKYTFTLTNRLTQKTVKLKLQPNGAEGGYEVVSTTGSDITEIANDFDLTVTTPIELEGTSVKFKTLSATANDGFLKFTENQMKNGVYMTISGADDIYGEQTFNVITEVTSITDDTDVLANLKKEDKKIVFYPEASAVKTQNITTTAYLKGGKVVFDKDTLEAPAYLLKTKEGYLRAEKINHDKNDAARVIGLNNNDGGYGVFAFGREGSDFEAHPLWNDIKDMVNRHIATVEDGEFSFSENILSPSTSLDFSSTNFIDVVNTTKSLEAKTRYASLDNVLGSITYQLNKNAINEGILKDTAIFRLNVVDTAAIEKGNMAEFYISKYVGQGDSVRMFMFNAADSMKTFVEGDAQEVTNTKYILEGTTSDPKVVFNPASLIAADTLVAGADTLTAKAANAYKFNIVSTGNEGEYTINSVKDGAYVYALNGRLGLTRDDEQAFKFTLGADQMPTANETIAASEVTVAATTGAVVVKGAAGKSVVVTNILGQTLANTVITSDNATIAVPAGIVIVAVEGEEAAKVVVK